MIMFRSHISKFILIASLLGASISFGTPEAEYKLDVLKSLIGIIKAHGLTERAKIAENCLNEAINYCQKHINHSDLSVCEITDVNWVSHKSEDPFAKTEEEAISLTGIHSIEISFRNSDLWINQRCY